MATHLGNGTNGHSNAPERSFTIRDLPKSNNFTSKLPSDSDYPTPTSSHSAERKELGPRLVKNAAFTFVRPEPFKKSELVAVSAAALKDLAIDPASVDSEDFRDTVAGRTIITIDETGPKDNDVYPWAQCYGGYQFGSWAGQLGDGRAISLFETTNPNTGVRYEIQLKGAGKTPYSRFADGKAVVRSSIREFVVSEALNALGIPTTRALSLTLGPEERVRRETTEPAAIVARFAQSWLRIGTFDLARARGDRKLVRQLADYVAEEVFPGWTSLPGHIPTITPTSILNLPRNISATTLEGTSPHEENRYHRLFREIVRRNALTVAHWQAYAFTNGVLNTDNTSIFGLSIDFGPFAFLDNFDPAYTPNHDDHLLRYAYRNQPTIIWWNLVRLAEAFAELIGAGPAVDEPRYAENLDQAAVEPDEIYTPELIARAEALIERAREEYQAVFLAEYKRLMTARLGLKTQKEGDFDGLFSALLDTLEALELDFHHAFRRLSGLDILRLKTEKGRREAAGVFFHAEGLSATVGTKEEEARGRLAEWLDVWAKRVEEDWGTEQDARMIAMKKVNPKFVPRNWVLDEIIRRVEKEGDREVLDRVMKMTLAPFEESWGGDAAEEERWCGDVPRAQRAMQCSCSS